MIRRTRIASTRPTTGIHLRTLLKRLVDEDFIDQLFIATHSNLFDLDPEGYYEVTHDPELETQVARKPIHEIDAHLLEQDAIDAQVTCYAGYARDLKVGWDPSTLPEGLADLFAQLSTETTRQLALGVCDEKAIKRALQTLADRLHRSCRRTAKLPFMFQATAQQLIRDLRVISTQP